MVSVGGVGKHHIQVSHRLVVSAQEKQGSCPEKTAVGVVFAQVDGCVYIGIRLFVVLFAHLEHTSESKESTFVRVFLNAHIRCLDGFIVLPHIVEVVSLVEHMFVVFGVVFNRLLNVFDCQRIVARQLVAFCNRRIIVSALVVFL